MNYTKLCSRIIEYSFYTIFFLVPLVLAGDTSELFEFNKMWTAFALGIIIAAAWISKSILQGGIKIQKTPLDIPILLFFVSQFMATLFSMDSHISIWGYYSRFNGGLLSTILYIFLFYAFVSNILTKAKEDEKIIDLKPIRKILTISLASGFIVALWGIPSKFGYDPTCYLFRGTLDVSCWADDFQPKVRIFSTLGQPDWLAAYMSILIPVSIALFINSLKQSIGRKLNLLGFSISLPFKIKPKSSFYFVCIVLFYLSLLYSGSKSGILATWLSIAALFGGYFYIYGRRKINFILPLTLVGTVVIITFFAGQAFGFLNNFTYSGISQRLNPLPPAPKTTDNKKPAPLHSGELGGSDSGKIRLLVWEGAINAWKNNPLFGTGVETFAFAYYKYKPAEHNLVSEWNFLYNKAHNEFLNLLATTGLFGLGSYLSIIFVFIYKFGRKFLKEKNNPDNLLVIGLVSGYISISITNFFGFSVVIVNAYFFLIPAFVLAIQNLINKDKFISFLKTDEKSVTSPSSFQLIGIIFVCLISTFLLYNLLNYWNADKAYAYGSNLSRVGYNQDAQSYLEKAQSQRPGEPIFMDELAVNSAMLATQLISQADPQDATSSAATANALAEQAINYSDQVISSYPNNFVFWKTRVRIFYSLSQVSQQLLPQALEAAKRAQALAPNDASINHNLGVIEGQSGNIDNAIAVLERTAQLKPDHREVRFALGLFYFQKALDQNEKVIDRSYLEKAKAEMKYILNYLNSGDTQAKEALKQLEAK